MKKTILYSVLLSGLTSLSAVAGPIKAAQGLGSQIQIGTSYLGNTIKGQIDETSNGLVAFYDKAKKRFSVVATGNQAVNLYRGITGSTAAVARTYLGFRKGSERTVLVVAGDTVDWAVKTALGIPENLLAEIPGAGLFVADLSVATNKFTTTLSGSAKTVGFHILKHGYGIANDAVNLIEEIVGMKSTALYSSGKFITALPGKVLGLLGAKPLVDGSVRKLRKFK